MAKRSKARSAKTATTAGTPRDRILDATLALAEREGWRKASLGAIAGEAGCRSASSTASFGPAQPF